MKTPIYKTTKSINQEPIAFECTECDWQGTQEEKAEKYTDIEYGIKEQICPKCGCNDFYGIIGYKKD